MALISRHRLIFAAIAAVLIAVGGTTAAILKHRAAEAQASSPVLPIPDSTPLWKPQVYDYKGPSPFKAGTPLRPMDVDILEAIAAGKLKRADMADLFPDRPYRVRLMGSVDSRWISSVLIDLDRDGKNDEAWFLKPEQVVRRDLPKDEGGTKEQVGSGTLYALRPGRWLPF